MMRKVFRYAVSLAMLIIVVGCASSTRNDVNTSSSDVFGITSGDNGAELYGSVRLGVKGHL